LEGRTQVTFNFPLFGRGHDDLHPLGAHDLHFSSGNNHLIDGIRDSIPKLASDSHVATGGQTILRHAARADEGLRTRFDVLVGKPKERIHQQVFKYPSDET